MAVDQLALSMEILALAPSTLSIKVLAVDSSTLSSRNSGSGFVYFANQKSGSGYVFFAMPNERLSTINDRVLQQNSERCAFVTAALKFSL